MKLSRFARAAYRLMAILMLAILLASGCSSETKQGDTGWFTEAADRKAYEEACAEVTGCEEPRFAAPGRAESIWRVVVARSGSGEIRIGRIESIEVPEGDGVPVGQTSGTHALIGLDAAGKAVDGQPIHFPETMRIEYAEASRPVDRIDLSDRDVDVIAYVRALPSIERLVIQDESGAEVASAPAEALVAAHMAVSPIRSAGLPAPTLAERRRPWQGLPPYCSHVILLQGEADRRLAANITFHDQVELIKPGPWQIATAQGALARMTPLLCQSIARIAFGRVPSEPTKEGAVNSAGAGDMMLINVSAKGYSESELKELRSNRLFMQRTITHEAGHTAETLLTSEGARAGNYGGAWGLPPRTLVGKTIGRVRLEKGLKDEWLRMHESFVDQGWAASYPSGKGGVKERDNWSPKQVAHGGFMSQYGSKAWWDDIAEFVAHSYVAPELTAGIRGAGRPEDLRQDFACREMQSHDEKNVPARLAAAYTKLLFLKDLGLVTQQDVTACTGPNLGLSTPEPGFQFWQGTMRLRSFRNGLKAGIGTKAGGKKVFTMSGEGEANFGDSPYPARIDLQLDLGGRFDTLDEVSWPRGVYQLGLTGDNNLRLRLDGAKAGNFDAMRGFVLVSESSNERISGSIFLTQAFRLHAPLPVPQVFDPPLTIRFLIER
jgi:hypothetical protein